MIRIGFSIAVPTAATAVTGAATAGEQRFGRKK